MLYEALLVFGVLFIADLLFEILAQSRHALTLHYVRQFWLFMVMGAYFIFFWCRSGQTLAMKTWRIKLVAPGSPTLTLNKAVLRYLLAWMWFLPAMALDYFFGTQELGQPRSRRDRNDGLGRYRHAQQRTTVSA